MPPPVTARYEDAGLFRNEVCKVAVELIPVINRNDRGDFVVLGSMEGGSEISVVFAGRRMRMAEPLIQHLNKMHDTAVRSKKDGVLTPVELRSLRQKARLEGTWRPRFLKRDDGWQTREYYLMVSRWEIFQPDGTALEFGVAPDL